MRDIFEKIFRDPHSEEERVELKRQAHVLSLQESLNFPDGIDVEAEIHYYEGTWQTVLEDGVYKMRKSKIKEVENPEWNWFYSF